MRILVTGTEGYLGSLLAPELLRRGYEVIGLDIGFYKERVLYPDGATTPLTLAKDLRLIEAAGLRGVDAVVHMAELSNDPAGQLAPNITYDAEALWLEQNALWPFATKGSEASSTQNVPVGGLR